MNHMFVVSATCWNFLPKINFTAHPSSIMPSFQVGTS
uniref:Uncharacterized protein n=1 Tax=Rhizophora mucronata TaxID=61149 RepID=A0A2P2KJ71_RHIMU